jgi:dTMP kinase
METPKFITFEGGEGGGKSTQLKRLSAALEKAGLSVVQTREPGGAPSAEEIRNLLVSGSVDRWQPQSEVFLNYAARVEHVSRTVKPALDDGEWVLSDRFADSTMAYQGYGHGLDRGDLKTVYQIALGDFAPDLTIILDIPVDAGLTRAGSRGDNEDRYERMGTDFHQRLRDGFLAIAAAEPDRCKIVDASKSIDDVERQIIDTVNAKFGLTLS